MDEKFGGKEFNFGGVQEWNFGWIPEHNRTTEQKKEHSSIMASMPKFAISGAVATDVKKAVLWDYSKKFNGGNHFTVFRQVTGSCVGNGGGQAVWYLSAMEVSRLGDVEEVKLPFYLLPYGRSRYYLGDRGPGEGSTGSAFAKAITVDGIVPADVEGLPSFTTDNGISWGSKTEYAWSDGGRISEDWLKKSRVHLVKTAAPVLNSTDVKNALINGYPCTIASNWGGQMSPSAQGTPAVLLNRRATTWNHQMCIIGWWDHPTLGDIFYILNSWGLNAHGQPADDAPPGGFWVKKEEVDYITRQEDSYAFSQFDGFPAQKLDWLI